MAEMKTTPKIARSISAIVVTVVSSLKRILFVALLTLLAILPSYASNQIHRTDAPDGFYVSADAAPSYALSVRSTSGSPETVQIREDGTFLPQRFTISGTDQIPGGYFVQISSKSIDNTPDVPGLVIAANHKAYFGYARRAGSSRTVSLLVDNREDAEAVSSMLHKKFPSAQSSVDLRPINPAPTEISVQDWQPSTNWHWNQALVDALSAKANQDQDIKEALAYSRLMMKARVNRMPEPPSQFPLPNAEGYAGHPLPNYVNFYGLNDYYPNYLLCTYDVDEKDYHQSDESKWFKAALKQILRSGPKNFPPIEWIAVVIKNRAEHKDASTFEQSHKVGAIFRASDVFDSSHVLSQLIAGTVMDRHPFKYDPIQPTPGDQQRWLIVERHSVTNKPTTGDKK
jgi:hypothetical protein